MLIKRISIRNSVEFNEFDGYGICVFNINTGNFSCSLVYIMINKHHKDKGEFLILNINILFYLRFKKILKVIKKPQNYCAFCEEYFCETPFIKDSKVYCSKQHCDLDQP